MTSGSSRLGRWRAGFRSDARGVQLREQEPNAFASYLRGRFRDFDGFCDEAQFPQRLTEFAEEFRNRAMHAEDLSAEECTDARNFLLNEPTRLLLKLAEELGR